MKSDFNVRLRSQTSMSDLNVKLEKSRKFDRLAVSIENQLKSLLECPMRISRSDLLQSTGNYFHVYNRGVDRQRLFFSTEDYRLFLDLMKVFLPQSALDLLTFTLMPNHFHLIVKQQGPYAISRYVKAVCERYVISLNRQRNRCGHLFQSRYKLKHIDREEYLLYLSRYIHLNPVGAKLVQKPEEWEFSSCPLFRNGLSSGFITTKPILTQVGGPEAYWQYLHSDDLEFTQEMERYLIDRELL
jgi:putative transposase